MKMTEIKKAKGYKSIRVDFASKEEFDLFGTLFNCTPVTDAMDQVHGKPLDDVNDQLGAMGADIHQTHKLAAAIVETPYIQAKFEQRVARKSAVMEVANEQ